MSLPDWLKGKPNLDSPQREAVDNVRPFVTLCNKRDIAVITWMIAEMSTDFWSCRADLGIKDRGFIEQWIKSLVITDMEWKYVQCDIQAQQKSGNNGEGFNL